MAEHPGPACRLQALKRAAQWGKRKKERKREREREREGGKEGGREGGRMEEKGELQWMSGLGLDNADTCGGVKV